MPLNCRRCTILPAYERRGLSDASEAVDYTMNIVHIASVSFSFSPLLFSIRCHFVSYHSLFSLFNQIQFVNGYKICRIMATGDIYTALNKQSRVVGVNQPNIYTYSRKRCITTAE